MFRIVAVVAVVLVASLLIYAAARPDTFHIVRTTTIQAPPEMIFALINDLHRWSAWSPYEQKDPAMKRAHSGAASGKGAVYAWDGDRNIGKGRMEITDTMPPTGVTIRLDFEKPFEAHNVVEFRLQPAGGATSVAWSMQGRSNFISRLIGVFIDMDRMIGRDFEAGLASLKAVAERQADVTSPASYAPMAATF